jgi:hypothetical protein
MHMPQTGYKSNGTNVLSFWNSYLLKILIVVPFRPPRDSGFSGCLAKNKPGFACAR